MKLTKETAHSVELRNGKNRCTKCGRIEPDLTKPCPGKKRKPAGAVAGRK